jgi:hypothetical protein
MAVQIGRVAVRGADRAGEAGEAALAAAVGTRHAAEMPGAAAGVEAGGRERGDRAGREAGPLGAAVARRGSRLDLLGRQRLGQEQRRAERVPEAELRVDQDAQG